MYFTTDDKKTTYCNSEAMITLDDETEIQCRELKVGDRIINYIYDPENERFFAKLKTVIEVYYVKPDHRN